MAWESVAAFWGVSLLFVLTPGADWAYAIAAGLRPRSVLPSVLGLLAGHLVATAVVAAGVAALVAGSPVVMTVLTVAGALYLVWMGISALRAPVTPALVGPVPTVISTPTATPAPSPVRTVAPAPVPVATGVAGGAAAVSGRGLDHHMAATTAMPIAAEAQVGGTPWWRQLAAGVGVSGLNPKVFLLFLALLPQFTDPTSSWPVAGQIVALGLVHVASCAVVYTAVGIGARTVLRARPGAARVVTRISGAAMVVIGAVLLIDRLAISA